MEIKTKKRNSDGVVRLETSGDIKEFFIKENFLKPRDAKISICFKGKDSSGIVNLSFKEVEKMFKEILPQINDLKKVKIMKFKN